MSNYRDYSQHARVAEQPQPDRQVESGGNTRGMPGEQNWQDMSTKDLEKAAQDNHDRPLGTFVGDYHVKGKEGPEEAYVGGSSAFGVSLSSGQGFTEVDQGDVGRAYGQPDDDGYYASEMGATPATSSGRHAAPSTQPGRDHDRRPDSFSPYEPKRIPRKNPDYGSSSRELGYDPNDRTFTNDLERPRYPTQTFYQRCWLEGFQLASAIGTSLTFNLIVVLAVISHVFKRINPFHKDPPRPAVEKEYEDRISGERYSARAKYYAEFFGYECEDIDVETEDGFVLRVHHLISQKHEKPGHPVILQHGILSNSVTYMVNEERSLAFWLLEQGYDVYLGNIRTNFKMPHRHYPRSDPRYWAWDVKDIGLYDVPAIVEYVNKRTGLKPAYIGHSQGASTMFIALSRGMRPDIGNKISSFIALAPAVYAGPALRHFPFSLMRRFKSRWAWKLVFGVREFIPIISLLQAILPSWFFGHTANVMFAFIFGFHDHNWLKRQVPKFFRTVAVGNASELLYYMGVFSYANCVFDTTATEPWFPPSFPPLAVFYGTLDTLVLGKPLVERIRSHEPHVRMLRAVALENYGAHQDPLWAYTAAKECYPGIREMIEETRHL
ncbi:hypothetical protein JCM5296_002544 [Sporobolomyces johnsonii]